jgi:glycosyltransferase involved in cell wall biosynthesis
MRILIFNWRDIKHEWAGGSEVYIFELAKRWVKMGHDVSLFCGQDVREKLPEEETIDGIKVFRKGSMFTLYFWAFWYYMKKFKGKFDVIIDVQNGIPFFTNLYSSKPKISVVYHVHGKQFFVELPFPLSIIGYVTERYLFPTLYGSTQIMAISQTTKGDLMKLGFKKNKIKIIYCGIDEKRNGKVHKFHDPTILYLGRIKKYKRVDLLVRIMPKILEQVPRARLLIAGWGTEASTVIDMSMRSINRRKVKIIGPVSEAEKKYLLSRAWVFVNPSIGEGWGISIIEANLHGTPAVAFNVSGLSESIKNNETGFLVPNEKELVKMVCLLLRDEDLRHRMSKNALDWAKKFNWDDAARDSIKLIEETVSK